MTYKEYCNQADPQRQVEVFITDEDAVSVEDAAPYARCYVTIKFRDQFFTYIVGDYSDRMHCIDADGNMRGASCFKYVGDQFKKKTTS